MKIPVPLKPLLLLFSVLFYSTSDLFAQQAVTDSLVNWVETNPEIDSTRVRNLNRLTSLLYRGYPDSARAYSKEAINISQELSYSRGEAQAYRLYGYTFFVKGQFDSTLFYFDNALELFQTSGNEEGKAAINAAKAAVYAINDEFELAIQAFLEAASNFEAFGNATNAGVMYNNVGNVYLEQELYEDAYRYYQQALNILDNPKDQPILSMVYANLAIASFSLNEFDSSLVYTDRGIKYSNEYERFAYLASLYTTKGRILLEREEYQASLESLESALENNERFGSKEREVSIKLYLATAQEKTGNDQDARTNLLYVLSLIEENDLKVATNYPNALNLMALVEQKLGNYASGLEYSQEANAILDSLHKEEIALKISELETIYETEKKEAQIQLLEIENQVANLRTLIIGIIGLVLLISVILGFWGYHRRKAEERRLKMESMKKELQQFGLVISEKNSFISRFREDLEEVRQHVRTLDGRKELTLLVDSIHQNINLTEDEQELFQKIEKLNSGFYIELRKRYENLTSKDERLATLVQMDLTNKDIANVMHVEPDSVKQAKRRLKRKLQLDGETDLGDYLKSLVA